MTQPKREDELALYKALREAAATSEDRAYWGGRSNALQIIERLSINEKRAFYLLSKWAGKGWVDYGMWVWGGWFTEDAPASLRA
ncbi:hypothetical protein L3067_01410 [Xanthomonas sp. PPL568]|uniref:hypothetical protein n=1 Tax=Xanthomonas indica TaxID=2912242 RepID=UPI001F5651AA|nr:hypothetical protein [Xanthomonas indica]MCI2243267.1 hypothetical protein [Xanthomonas indica]